MKYCEQIEEVLISSSQIKQKVSEMAERISADFRGTNLLVVGVLKGAWVFLADLLRELENDCDVDFLSVSSYGNGTTSSGKVKLVKDLTIPCQGRDVLIVEDIVDSGVTLSYIRAMLLERNAASVTIASLLSKPSRRKTFVDVKYVGFEIPDKFVVGYGMDYAERYRTLPEVCVLKQEFVR